MRTDTFQFTIPSGGSGLHHIDVSTVGTGLNGLAQDVPVVVNAKADTDLNTNAGLGDGVITVRASAPDTLRFAVRNLQTGVPIDVLVTEL